MDGPLYLSKSLGTARGETTDAGEQTDGKNYYNRHFHLPVTYNGVRRVGDPLGTKKIVVDKNLRQQHPRPTYSSADVGTNKPCKWNALRRFGEREIGIGMPVRYYDFVLLALRNNVQALWKRNNIIINARASPGVSRVSARPGLLRVRGRPRVYCALAGVRVYCACARDNAPSWCTSALRARLDHVDKITKTGDDLSGLHGKKNIKYVAV